MIEPIYNPSPSRYDDGMVYRRAGRSGVLLPLVSLGLWQNFGSRQSFSKVREMAHYAFGTSLANLGVMLPGMISGAISDSIGYQSFFLWSLLATIPAFLLTWKLPFSYDSEGKPISKGA